MLRTTIIKQLGRLQRRLHSLSLIIQDVLGSN